MKWRVDIYRRSPLLVVLLSFCGILLGACQPLEGASTKPVTLRIAGATAMQPLLYDLTTAFRQRHPQLFFELAGGGSTIGEERVFTGQIDLAVSTLISPTMPSVALQNQRPISPLRTPIGLDGLAIIVHPNNPLENLTIAQLRALYSGQLLRWEDVGGLPEDVLLISREDGSGSRQLFEARVMEKERVSLTALVMPTSADVVDYVAEHPNAIGYVSRAYVLPFLAQTNPATGQSAADGQAVRVVALEGQLPTREAIQSQSYPLIQPLYFVSRTRPTGWLQQLIDFALSPAGQEIVARYHVRVR
ncbi:MAG: phosphate ABC transporter substrate-binding protein [Caldilineaceae bacterium]